MGGVDKSGSIGGRVEKMTRRFRQGKQLFSRNTLNIALVAALSLNVLGTGLPALLAQYNEQQARIPHALKQADNEYAPAADANASERKPARLDKQAQNSLIATRDELRYGKAKKNPKRIQALEEGRDETSRVFLNDDGTKTLEKSASATSYRDKSGKWQDVDMTIDKDPVKDEWRTRANSWQAVFKELKADGGIELRKGQQTVSMRPLGTQAVKPVITGKAPKQLVTYKNAWPGVDLKYVVSGSELKEVIWVNDPKAVHSFEFQVGGSGFTPDDKHPGTYKLDGELDGFSLTNATATTANKGYVDSSPFVKQTLSGDRLKVLLDQAWLEQQGSEAYPVVIDPSFVSGNTTNFMSFNNVPETCAWNGGCGNNVGNDTTYGRVWRLATHHDYSQLQVAGRYLVSAQLYMEMVDPGVVWNRGTEAARGFYVQHAGSLSFGGQDYSYGQSSATIGTSGSFDVTSIYRSAISANNWGAWLSVLAADDNNNSIYSYKFFSSSMTKVTFNYTNIPSVSTLISPANESSVVSTQPFLKASGASDPDGQTARYKFKVATSPDAEGGAVINSGWLDSPAWTVPDGALQDGSTYYWKVQAWDGQSTNELQTQGSWSQSAVRSFKVDMRNGKDTTQAFDATGPVNVDLATGNLTTGSKSHSIAALGGALGVNLDYNSPQRSRSGLVGEYWSNATGTSVPATAPNITRVEGAVDFPWYDGSPQPGVISNDNYMARWTGYFVAPQTGNYQFGCHADDGSRIWVNDQLVVDQWTWCGTPTWSSTVALTAGQIVPIKVEYREITGGAGMWLHVKTPDNVDQIVPTEWLQTGSRSVATEYGLTGRYYYNVGSNPPTFPTNENDPSLFLKRTDSSPSLYWPNGVGPVPGGTSDNIMVRWSGYFTPDATDTYKFQALADDGVRIWVDNGSTPVLNDWTDTPGWHQQTAAGTPMNANQSYPITIEFYEHGGSATFELHYSGTNNVTKQVPSRLLSPKAQTLPDGWTLGGDAQGDMAYDFASIGANSVVLRGTAGDSHEYKWTGTSYASPPNEDGQLTRNDDGTLTLQAADGRTYLFGPDGKLVSATLAADDRNPAAIQYEYGLTPARLIKIKDGANTSRFTELLYAGDSRCPAAPSGFVGATGTMLCAVITTDGSMTTPTADNTTKFFYVSDVGGPRLARVVSPGSETSDFAYMTEDPNSPNSCPGCLSQVRDALANDTISAGVRTQNDSVTTQITYDALARVASVTGPAPTASAGRLAHTYEYAIGNTKVHTAGATEPHGFSRKISYDSSYRTTEDRDAANVATATEWDAAKDLVKSVTDGVGLKSTTHYDYADRAIEQYGPAPSAWYGGDRKPLSGNEPSSGQPYASLMPRTDSGYDQGISSLAAAFYSYSSASKALSGAPKSHQTGIGGSNGDINKTWGGTAPFTTTTAWGTRLTGDILLGATGNYTFRIGSDDGARLWIDDKLVVGDWTDGSYRSHPQLADVTVNNATANSYHRIRIEYYNKSNTETDAQLILFMTPPGGSEQTGLGSLLVPRYGLPTSSKTYDSSASVGDRSATTSYGANPELALPQSTTVDPGTGALNLTKTAAYETQGASGSFLRQTSKYLPGSNTAVPSNATQYSYYTASETRDNPCTTGTTEAYRQAGMLKLKTEADPDNTGTVNGSQTSRTAETIYDDAGRVVAARFNTDSWTCNSYDTRGRITQIVVPAFNGSVARTVTSNWSVGGNPLVVSMADPEGTIRTTSDLLGRTTAYMDARGDTTTYTYDSLGRLTGKASLVGNEEYIYDSYNRLTSQKLDTVTLAAVTYDTYSRITEVTYPTAGQQKLTISRNALGRTTSTDYTLGNGATHLTDTVTRSQSGQVVSGTELGAAKSYSYDKAGRLTGATVGTHSFAYGFGTADCTGPYSNLQAGKNSNRTSSTIDGVLTKYCYDQADRLEWSSDKDIYSPIYDAHGNITRLGSTWDGGTTVTEMFYDSADRVKEVRQNYGVIATKFNRDAQNRIAMRWVNENGTNTAAQWYGYTGSDDSPDYSRNQGWAVTEKFVQLPGGVLLTIRPGQSGNANKVFSLPNTHGDVMATTDASGAQTGTFQYDPFGVVLSATKADNATAKGDFGWVGSHQKFTEKDMVLTPINMGVRLYIPKMGRFTSIDPVDGGTPSAYVYPPDPVNTYDLDGRNTAAEVVANAGENANNTKNLGGGMLVLGIMACIAGNVACVVAGVAGAAIEGAQVYAIFRDPLLAVISAGGVAIFGNLGGQIGLTIANRSIPFVAPIIANSLRNLSPSISKTANTPRTISSSTRVGSAIAGNLLSSAAAQANGTKTSSAASPSYRQSVLRLGASLIGSPYVSY